MLESSVWTRCSNTRTVLNTNSHTVRTQRSWNERKTFLVWGKSRRRHITYNLFRPHPSHEIHKCFYRTFGIHILDDRIVFVRMFSCLSRVIISSSRSLIGGSKEENMSDALVRRRRQQYKKTVSFEEGRRKRTENAIQIRKSKRMEGLRKRRLMARSSHRPTSMELGKVDESVATVSNLHMYTAGMHPHTFTYIHILDGESWCSRASAVYLP